MTQAATSAAAPQRQSRVGRRPVSIPKGVTVNLSGRKIEVQGPKGKLSRELPERVALKKNGDVLQIETSATGSDAPRLQGLTRALVAAMIKGAVEGYEKTLEFVGTGYRAEVKGRVVQLSVGFSHPTSFELPPEVSASISAESKGTILVLSSANKSSLGQTAAIIRAFRPPEPYGGKGIRYRGEAIRRKAGKAGKAKGGK
jgi:large subunit ribosomal protein L6